MSAGYYCLHGAVARDCYTCFASRRHQEDKARIAELDARLANINGAADEVLLAINFGRKGATEDALCRIDIAIEQLKAVRGEDVA